MTYISSWIDTDFTRCYQVMETSHPGLLDEWMAHWSDIINFEVHPVITSAEAIEAVSSRL